MRGELKEVMPGEASGNQEELKVFEKMDVETWQTLAEFIASKYFFMKMMFWWVMV